MAGQTKIKIPSKTNPVSAAPSNGDATPSNGETTAVASEPAKPEMSGADKAVLFKKAFAYDDAINELLKQIEALKGEKSVAVKQVLDACGKGPFAYRGHEMTISSREGTFFFKDYGKRDLESIDAS